MATFTFGHTIDIHWNGYDIVGPAGTVFSIPDQLYEEFESDLRDVEPTLTWIDTNEFQTLQNSVTNYAVAATSPIVISSSTATSGLETKTWSISSGSASDGYVLTADGAGGVAFEASTGGLSSLVGTSPVSAIVSGNSATVSLNSGTNPNGYLLAADGTGGVIFTPASTSGLTSVVGVSPISTAVSGGTVSVSLNASYQTAGTYVNAVIGTSPASVVTASGTSTVSIDQAAITGATSANNAQVVRFYVKNTTGSTIDAGKAVYVSGATGDNALISLASATADPTSSKTLGLTLTSIANDAFGYVVEAGYITGIDTTGVTAGSSVWLGNTPGSLVFGAPPAEPSHAVYLGVVVREQQNNGSILVKVQNGYELDELHDVSAGSPTDLDILQYKNSSGLWTKASIANAGIASSVHTHDYQASGTYVNAVIGTSPASVSTASGTSTVSIIASSINSTHIADNAIVAAKINAGAVGTAKITSGAALNGYVLTADGAGAAAFLAASGGGGATVDIATFTASGTWTKPAGVTAVYVLAFGGGGGGGGGATTYGGGGGGGAAVVSRIFPASILGSTASVTIGAGGTGGAAGANGNQGGTTIFNASDTTDANIRALGGGQGPGTATGLVSRSPQSLAKVAGSVASPVAVGNSFNVNQADGCGGESSTSGGTQSPVNTGIAIYSAGGGGAGSGTTTGTGNFGRGGLGTAYSTGWPSGGAASGGAGESATQNFCGGAGGGGNSAGTGGIGGDGKLGGGGGGGGRGSTAGGAGGDGGDGYCLVISW